MSADPPAVPAGSTVLPPPFPAEPEETPWHFGMRGLLDMAQEWFAVTLDFHGRTPEESIGKIGYQFKGAPRHEGAIITRKDGSRLLRYVAVLLNAPWYSSGFDKLILMLDDCIAARHFRITVP